MRLFLSLSLIVLVGLTSVDAKAFSLKSIGDVQSAVKGLDCDSQAITLAKEGGAEILDVYLQVKAGKSIMDTTLKNKETLGAKVTKYVTDGCTDDLIKKALAAGASTLVE